MWKWFRKPDPEELERSRRELLLSDGRAVAGNVTDRSETDFYYTYEVCGVTYTAAQPIDLQSPAVTAELELLLGPVTVMYSPKNPANSMVLLTPPNTKSHRSKRERENTMLVNKIRTAAIAMTLAASLLVGSAVAANKPKTVIHIINVKFKADAKPEDVTKAINGIDTVLGKYKGIKNIWLKPIKNQFAPEYTHILVMEFESEDSLKKYAGSPEQKEWYKLYEPVRDNSRTNDVTN